MAPATSTSKARKLPVINDGVPPAINDKCTLRRNVAVQPYGRCSVCSLKLSQCHAWQSSAMSFALVILILVPLIGHEAWILELSVASALALLVVQGMVNHKRTDELIFGQHQLSMASSSLRATNAALESARQGLEREVAARTEKLRHANVELAAANLELAELARKREAMVLEVSHDLRTPLTSVKGAADNLIDGIAGPLGESQLEYVAIIRDHAARLIGAIGRLLETARDASAPVVLQPTPVELGDLTREVVRSLQPIAEERRVEVEVSDAKVQTRADPEKLRKVIENLVGNALKFTNPGGSVRVAVEQDDADVRITVRDTGVGIPRSDLDRVFDRFYRGHEDRPGSGLGLSITRDLVRLHGGEVHVESSVGEGSVFSAVLPRVTA
ncbi:MAG: HAMP domain-containing histidine kinase [Deltaproteobacteria bacterium]|nr:HAMP domain-containing histidine kinase [Deltaproteobacteria bacterium]